jgi:hypothetical protein
MWLKRVQTWRSVAQSQGCDSEEMALKMGLIVEKCGVGRRSAGNACGLMVGHA